MNVSESEEFQKEFKKFRKKYRTLADDFEVAKKAIMAEPTGDGSKHWNVLKQRDEKYILKTRMMCRAVKGASFRLIYFYDGENLELMFVEIFFKGSKDSENKKRIDDVEKRLME